MNPSPAQQWSELSALYEHADGLAAGVLAEWLAKLARERHPLLPQLQRMLAARAEFETNDFLGTLPKLAGSGQTPVAWAEGRQVGAYRLLRPLGEGGMAEVWLAERADGAIKRRVAIKLPYPRPGRETFAVRFDRERDILATLRHPNIAGLYDAGVTPDGQAWLALEYVDGEPLAAWCDAQRLALRERVMLFRQVLLAVQHAHTNLVIHRDLKPGNILVTPQGEVRLLDFGIAKLLEAEGDAIAETELTRQAGRTMTPRYASPEQLTGVPLTTGSDVYSLGVVFYELVCGERPYELKVESAGQLEHAILEIEPRAPSRRALSDESARERGGVSVKALRKALAPELDAIALRCLAKQPSARYASVDAVIADIDRWLGGEAVLARAPGAWYRFRKFAARHRVGVALGAVAVAALVATTAVAVVMGLQAREESARAVAARDFMLSIFKRADQEKSRGADITARDILETGRKDVLTRLAGQPRLQAELLQGIGEIQRDMSDFSGSSSTFAEVARIQANFGSPRDQAMALADRADAAMRLGDLALAQQSWQQAGATPGRQLSDGELNLRLSEVEGWLAYSQGNAAKAKDAFLVAKRLSTEVYGAGHVRTMEGLRGLVYAERDLHNYESALQQLEALESLSRKVTGDDSRARSELDLDRVSILFNAGRFAQGMADASESLVRCSRAQIANAEHCQQLRLTKSRFALKLDAFGSMVDDTAALERMAFDSDDHNLRAEALGILLRLQAGRGGFAEGKRYLQSLVTLCDATGSDGLEPSTRLIAMMAITVFELRQGTPGGAKGWLDKVGALSAQLGDRVPLAVRGNALLLRGVWQLNSGQPGEALRTMRLSQELVSSEEGPRHPVSALVSINTAIALQAIGDAESARQVVAEAMPVLRSALGQDSGTYRRLELLQSAVQRNLERQRDALTKTPTNRAARTSAVPVLHDFFI